MNWDKLLEWAAIFISSGFAMSVVQFIFNRIDAKNGTKKELQTLSNAFEEYKATLARTHILRFADELHNGLKHSKEYFEQQILDIDTYNKYCDTHPGFKNGLTEMSSEFIKEEYNKEFLSRKEE